MKLIKLKCPNCNADVEVNKELEEATCNYCGAKFLIEDENQTKEERIIKAISKKEEKDRKYFASEDYEKKVNIEERAKDRGILGSVERLVEKRSQYKNSQEYKEKKAKEEREGKIIMICVFSIMGIIILIAIIRGLTAKSDSIDCYINETKYNLNFAINETIKCPSCDDDMLKELNDKYNDLNSIKNTRTNIETYFENRDGYCGYKPTSE